jgi:hypothetical protein
MEKKIDCCVDGCTRARTGRARYCSRHQHNKQRYGDPLVSKGTASGEPQRFIERLVHAPTDVACVIWPYNRTAYGYGRVKISGRDVGAHRYLCGLIYGPPPTLDHEAAHRCGNGHLGCVNPRHLKWATRKENAEDMVAADRSCVGEKSGRAKLTNADVRKIRGLLAGHWKNTAIAQLMGVSETTISRIKTGYNWTHVL